MLRKVNGAYNHPQSTRDILGIKPHQFAIMITALQRYYHQSDEMRPEIESILKDLNQPYEGAQYPVPNPHIKDVTGN